MWPSTPLNVNSGMNPAMMIPAANRIDWLTLVPARPVSGGLTELPEYPLDHDDGRIDDQPEVDCADGQEVGRLASQHHDSDGEEQRERYRRRDDEGAPQIAQKHPLQHEDQQDSEHHVVQDRVRRDVDEILPVVDPLDLGPRRQNA